MTGQHKPGRWPRYALWALEDTQAALIAIERLARAVQEAAKRGNAIDVVMLAGDIRHEAMNGREYLAKGKAGER